MTVSDVASVPPATPVRALDENIGSAPTPISSNSSSLNRTVVTAKRKEELLLQARAERKRWIRTVPLPYDPKLLLANDTTDDRTKDDAANCLWSSRESLDKFQRSLVFRDRLLQGATSILSELYGIGSALDDSTEQKKYFDVNNSGEGCKTLREVLPNRPLSVDDVADRVDKLTKPFLATKEKEWRESPTSIGVKNDDDAKPVNPTNTGDSTQGDKKRDIGDDRYKDVRAAYEQFTNLIILPESAFAVQGMKNFVRNFDEIASSKKENDDDKLVRNMASAVNDQIRSSYDSLTAKKKISVVAIGQQGQGQPDLDRRSLESFLYGQVKTMVDTTLDRILGNTATPPSPSSPFLMTQIKFDNRLEELQFLQPSHLELACLNDDIEASTSQTKLDSLLEGPINALRSLESFYSPYEKLCRVLDVYHGVNAVLKNASKSLPMADDVISAMILVIVKASAARTKLKTTSLRNLLRDLHFVENFALQEYKRLGGGEVEYAFTSLYGAVYFLQGVELDFTRGDNDGDNKSSNNRLCISNEELLRGLEKCRALAANNKAKSSAITGGNNGDRENLKGFISRGANELLREGDPDDVCSFDTKALDFVPAPRQLSVRDVRAARLRGETLSLKWALRQQGRQSEPELVPAHAKTSPASPTKSPSRSVFTSQRYTFLGVKPENIKLSDLPRLLDEYQKLVIANEQLVGEHQRANNKIHLERKRIRDENHRRTLGEQVLLM